MTDDADLVAMRAEVARRAAVVFGELAERRPDHTELTDAGRLWLYHLAEGVAILSATWPATEGGGMHRYAHHRIARELADRFPEVAELLGDDLAGTLFARIVQESTQWWTAQLAQAEAAGRA